MASSNFKCDDCGKEFLVSFVWLKPKDVNCPNCGGNKITEVKSGCGCGSDDKGGFRFR